MFTFVSNCLFVNYPLKTSKQKLVQESFSFLFWLPASLTDWKILTEYKREMLEANVCSLVSISVPNKHQQAE
jgi:hypothetical protein